MARRHARQGFTLIEIMVVVIIVGILIGTARQQYKRAIDTTRATNHKANVSRLAITLETYASENEAKVPKPPVLNKAFTAADVGMSDYMTDAKMPSNPYPNEGRGHDGSVSMSGAFFYATEQELTWVSRPNGGVGTIKTGKWPKLITASPAPEADLPPEGTFNEVPMTSAPDMSGGVIYESDGSTYLMYGLGAVIPRAGSTGTYYQNTGVRTNLPDKVQNQ